MPSRATMTEAKTASLAELGGRDLGSRTARFDERDTILYALSVGAGAQDLEMVYERQLHLLPTFGLTLGLWVVEAAGALGVYDAVKTLHVGQELTVREPLTPGQELSIAGAIEAVWDKGSAALLEVSATSDAFTATYKIMVPGAGGFGGERGSSGVTEDPETAPDVEWSVPTSPEQAALYRLTGDLHPLHIDPDVARAAGFDRPILHGLCTLATVVRSLAAEAGAPAWELSELSARLTAPVYPGARLEARAWDKKDGFSFEAYSDGEQVLGAGRVAYAGAAV